ncbi:DUF4386 domain-containing protein [Priestia megaterium]|uniref:DUF4386 domain-containing protein n=1 Tax=Priestia megaterium (strain ATCC 14581 / DSM 32 / CCUG 1817 / JCM 2506 / NBRC 15308 / NCIMB 9376 / NCTC 10342 / NRRL B-14308 / VKM B-512 / Ford 19) TaxID=1348623 RepID=A0A0B6A7P6_PRIM2|nr:DUF4386 domain-containing protein [Priestia megaterium]AJI20915.1 hypothetical protein BG04_4121 [Priestia megaterium NBRC 15308 = ATCC 14581]KFM97344.1 hypothetical protein DJ91_1149 [Priestia megaterium]KGJ74390.1 hypothetical protein BMT_03530 [Priestia megaterium NBRC 15308 = ATCC 14581]MDR4235295.1 DUF4386 domain-containing protein [Priestia megaterium]MED3810603.1 DUF4386 domain-containing protein [Priestia megaterium]
MNSNKKAAKMVGVLFILAAVTAIIGLILYDPILNGPDYLTKGSQHANQVIVGTLMELILVASAIGTSTIMFPFLRKYNETIALWHVCFRFLEAVIITVGVISVLSLLTLSQEFVATGTQNTASFQASGTVLKAIHDWTFLLGPNIMLGINTMMYSYIFYRSKLVPRFIPILGMIGATLVFIAGLLEMFDVFSQLSVWGAILSLPVAANEMILAVWLIVKGFSESALASLDEKKKATR